MLIIKGKITITQYFVAMILSTILLVAVVAGAYSLEHNKPIVSVTMMLLSFVSLGASAKIIRMTHSPNKS